MREDSGQPDAWRDYQQVLSGLGLMYSLQVLPQITLTPLGLAHLDQSIGFSELMTLQSLRFQYPNGHQVAISPAVRTSIAGTVFASARSFVELQVLAGVELRPAVLVWRILRALSNAGEVAALSVDDIERYLMRCSTNTEHGACCEAIVAARKGGVTYPGLGKRERRNAQDWVKFLANTSIFSVHEGSLLTLSERAASHPAEIDALCAALEAPQSFWSADVGEHADRLRWYSDFGGVDLSLPELPVVPESEEPREFIGPKESEEQQAASEDRGRTINLREFSGLTTPTRAAGTLQIHSVYSAEISESAHRLHDQMVLLIAQTCQSRGARIYEDKRTVDLLIEYQEKEFIVEVKSVTPRNFVFRLRSALGQLIHYDYLRESQTELSRRKVLAFPAQIASNSWSIPFLNTFVGADLLTLESGGLKLHSPEATSRQLFG